MLKFRRRTSPWVWVALIAASLVIILVWQFITFLITLNTMPPGWSIAGAAVAGLSYERAVEQAQSVLSQQPIQLHYQDQTILLQPADVGVRFSPTATLQAIIQRRDAIGGPQGFLTFIVRRAPPPQDIPAVVSWSDELLRAYLAQVADQYDLSPQPPSPILDGLRMAPGRAGYELDISASVPDVVAALRSAGERSATLTIKAVPPPQPQPVALDSLVQTSLRGFDGIAGIYVKDMASGLEYEHNGGVAFSGMGILKIAVALEAFRRHTALPADELELVEQMLACEVGNGAANALLQKIGDGDAYLGVDRLTNSMRYLGLLNTFMATPYDQEVTPVAVVTPANSRPDISTAPDPRLQTTPRDIALLLEMIYACGRGGGALTVAYPNSFTPEQCQQMVGMMEQAQLTDATGQPAYLAGGLPAGTRLARKHSWSGNARGDAGIVFSPGADYVIVVFAYVPGGGEWQQVNPLFKDISKATYNFFNLSP